MSQGSEESGITATRADGVRVLIVAPDDLTRTGLAAVVSELSGFTVAGQTRGDENVAKDIDIFDPDIVIWDLSDSPERLQLLHEVGVPVVVMVSGEEAGGLAWSNDAKGILPRNVGRTGVAAALKAVAAGLRVVDNRLAGAIARSSTTLGPPLAENLTPRELQVLHLMAEGLTNKSIAATLAVSEHTVKFHINSILGKMGASSRTQAVTSATRLGLIKI
jgi:DNA-binding NarL/FixJ family response regulator